MTTEVPERWYWQIDDQGCVIRMALDIDGGVMVLPQVEGDDMDITLAPGPDGRPMLHRPDCPEVQMLRERGEPLMTLFDCQADPRDLDCPRHDCLDSYGEAMAREHGPDLERER